MENSENISKRINLAYLFPSVAVLALGFGWLLRYFAHVYLVVLLLVLFSGVLVGGAKNKNRLAKFASIALLCSVPLGGLLGLFWDNLFGST